MAYQAQEFFGDISAVAVGASLSFEKNARIIASYEPPRFVVNLLPGHGLDEGVCICPEKDGNPGIAFEFGESFGKRVPGYLLATNSSFTAKVLLRFG